MKIQKMVSTSAALAALSALVALAGCESIDMATSNCENIRQDIIELSEEDRASTGYALIAIYEPTEISRTDKEFKCSGEASWSDNETTSITYKQYIDKEGTTIIAYEVP